LNTAHSSWQSTPAVVAYSTACTLGRRERSMEFDNAHGRAPTGGIGSRDLETIRNEAE
jgi:hypothetical protein